jgi:hypothetical protein
MKIVDLHVEDPRFLGKYEDPWVELRVDTFIEERGEVIYPSGAEEKYRIIPCGPFFAVETFDREWIEVEDQWGEVNKLDILRGKQLFPVEVKTPDDEELPLAMEVPRLRRLIRRFRYPYVVLVDEQAAIQGKLQWRLEVTEPMCYGGALMKTVVCLNLPESTVLWRNTHWPLCASHLQDYQTLRKERRVS